MATGQPPFPEGRPAEEGLRQTVRAALGERGDLLPEALDLVIRECLAPAAALRPAAGEVLRRLLIARWLGGAYLSQFAEAVHRHLQAGRRLIAVQGVTDRDELMRSLRALAAHAQPVLPDGKSRVQYRLYHITEGGGLWMVDAGGRPDEQLVPWLTSEQVAATQRQLGQNGGPPDAATVLAVNAANLLGSLEQLGATGAGEASLVVLHGSGWWDFGMIGERLLRFCQSEPRSRPAVLIADEELWLPSGLARSCEWLDFPPPSPAVLFERLRRFVSAEQLPVPEVSAAMAITLARRFMGSHWRDVALALRLGALRHGVIDERALVARDEYLTERFALVSGVSYLPAGRLPGWDTVGLPLELSQQARRWAAAVAAVDGERAVSVPRRLLVTGEDGCGKSTFAQALAGLLGRPVLRIHPASCLRRDVGGSERQLREALAATLRVGAGVVLSDDVDQFFPAEPPGPAPNPTENPLGATLGRLGGLVLHWLDNLPEHLVAVLTARAEDRLAPPWQRRMELRWSLPRPQGAHRVSVLAALFRRHGLPGLAANAEFLTELASASDQGRVPAADARHAAHPSLRARTLRLHTGADLEQWLTETLWLHSGSDADVSTPAFWLAALQPLAPTERNPAVLTTT